MTTKPNLAETIARVEQQLALEPPVVSCVVLHRDDTLALLSCARRCEAIEGVTDASLAEWRTYDAKTIREDFSVDDLCILLGLAADRNLARADVEELRTVCERTTRLADGLMQDRDDARAESTRLRAELEKQTRLADHYRASDARADIAEQGLAAAQDRVQELEARLNKARELATDEADITLHPDHQMYQRTLLARDIVEALGPITDPTQGADTLKGNDE